MKKEICWFCHKPTFMFKDADFEKESESGNWLHKMYTLLEMDQRPMHTQCYTEWHKDKEAMPWNKLEFLLREIENAYQKELSSNAIH